MRRLFGSSLGFDCLVGLAVCRQDGYLTFIISNCDKRIPFLKLPNLFTMKLYAGSSSLVWPRIPVCPQCATTIGAGYLSNFDVYLGKASSSEQAELGMATKVVLNISRPFHNTNRHLYFDNFFNSMVLLEELLKVCF